MSGHTHTHIHTYTLDNYSDPHCAHARRGLIIIYNALANKGVNFLSLVAHRRY